MSARRLQAQDEYSALEELHSRNLTDGLPVVIPTPDRVERMILGGSMDAELALGDVAPAYGSATVEKVAINAVMAGCLPDHFPVVLAAVRAALQPQMDLGEMQQTTHSLGPVIIVNGPARDACGGIASGVGALGPGYRANAAIGRALRLVMMNIGGARPGTSDMAVLGQPGKFTACIAEAEESSPYPPLSEDLGFAAGQSVVTLVGVDAPHSILASPDADDPEAAERMARVLAAGIAKPGSNNTYTGKGTPLVIVNPDHARFLARGFRTRKALQQRLYELAVTPRRHLLNYANKFVPRGDPDKLIHAVVSPDHIVVVVAGGEGMYSAVCNAWGGGAYGARPASQEIELNQFCELPVSRQAQSATV